MPPGSFVILEDEKQPYLLLEDTLLAWRPEGHGKRIARPNDRMMQVLTPQSVVRTLAHGYKVMVVGLEHQTVQKMDPSPR